MPLLDHNGSRTLLISGLGSPFPFSWKIGSNFPVPTEMWSVFEVENSVSLTVSADYQLKEDDKLGSISKLRCPVGEWMGSLLKAPQHLRPSWQLGAYYQSGQSSESSMPKEGCRFCPMAVSYWINEWIRREKKEVKDLNGERRSEGVP